MCTAIWRFVGIYICLFIYNLSKLNIMSLVNKILVELLLADFMVLVQTFKAALNADFI